MTRRTLLIAGVAALLAMIAIVLAVNGTGEAGWRAVIRATARSSALCVALAIARVRAREFQILLPVSHGLHYAAIGAVAVLTTVANAHINPISLIGGAAIYGLMLFNAVRPLTPNLYILWIIFLIALGVNRGPSPVYPIAVMILVSAALVRVIGDRRRDATPNYDS
ncbi:MAG TPA: hypothetical protein VJZ00_03565 [Thermoanaerobaculia bacterium]|nr:hypothetical protein [Thermoanaerobaculia bacterium]